MLAAAWANRKRGLAVGRMVRAVVGLELGGVAGAAHAQHRLVFQPVAAEVCRDEGLQKNQQHARDAPRLVVCLDETANAREQQHARMLGGSCEPNLIVRVSIPQG